MSRKSIDTNRIRLVLEAHKAAMKKFMEITGHESVTIDVFTQAPTHAYHHTDRPILVDVYDTTNIRVEAKNIHLNKRIGVSYAISNQMAMNDHEGLLAVIFTDLRRELFHELEKKAKETAVIPVSLLI